MQRLSILAAALVGIVLGQFAASEAFGAERGTLSLVTAADQNMVDYVKDYLDPLFEKEHPGVTVKAVGTGPGDAGSQKIYEKLEAEETTTAGTSISR